MPQLRTLKLIVVISFLTLAAGIARAGYEAPVFIDGCQTADGRYVITAETTLKGKTAHGPNKWQFIWKDTKENVTKIIEPQGLQAGAMYGHLFLAPDGETFALWNHVTLWSSDKSNMHGPPTLKYAESAPEPDAGSGTVPWREREEFTQRLIIYRKDGTILQAFGVGDLVTPEEWSGVMRVFNRVHWLREYDQLKFKQTLRPGYAFYRISPDYTVIEFQVTPPAKAKQPPRTVRVSLTDGRLIPADEKLSEAKTPVRPWQGPEHFEGNDPKVREGYVPSLDPVRTPGKFTVEPQPKDAAALK